MPDDSRRHLCHEVDRVLDAPLPGEIGVHVVDEGLDVSGSVPEGHEEGDAIAMGGGGDLLRIGTEAWAAAKKNEMVTP